MYVFTPDEKKKMDKLDFNLGGGYCDFLKGVSKPEPSDDKFLFIGLGGRGCSTLARLKTEVHKQIKCPQGKLKPDSFEYLAIDTDKNALEQLCGGGLGEVGLSNDSDNQEIFELYDQQLAKLIKDRTRRPENIASWMNPNLSASLVGNGAGGIRQAGRGLLFGGQIAKLWKTLEAKLTKLHALINGSENLIVYVFAGVGGGTGSGTVIDIPYIVRKIIEDAHWTVKVDGYIFLPDTYDITDNTRANAIANSYAALQEIDLLMNMPMNVGVGSFKADYDTFHKVNSTEKIFDSCVLVSGNRGTEGGRVTNPDRFSKRVVIDNVISQITKTTFNKGQMLSSSFLDNLEKEVRTAVAVNGTGYPKNAYFQYLGIGIGAVELPLDQMMAYVAKGAVDKIDAGLNNHATDQDVNTFLNSLNMLPDEIGGWILQKSEVPLFSYKKSMKQGVTRDMIKDHRWFKNIQGRWMEHNAEMHIQWNIMRQTCTSEIAERLAMEFQKKFISPDYGIRFLNELLSYKRIDDNDKNKINGVLERIKSDYYLVLQGLINGARGKQKTALEDMQRMENGNYLTFPVDMFPYHEYGEACVNSLIWQDIENLYNEWVRKCLDEAVKDLEGKIGEIQKYLSIFDYLKQIVDGNYKTAMGGQMPSHAEYASQLLDFSQKNNDPNVQAVVDYLDGMLAQKTNAGLVSTFETKLWKEKQRWIDSEIDSEKDFDPIQTFVDFLEREFTPIVSLSLNQFLTMKYKVADMPAAIQKMCDELKDNANVLFPSIEELPLSRLPSNNWVIIPAGVETVSAGVKAYVKNLPEIRVAESTDRNHIYWYNLRAGIPLFSLKDIHAYEENYKGFGNEKGLHLFETESENWRDFPLLDNQALWSDYSDSDEIAYVQRIQKDVRLFQKAGLIQSNKEPKTDKIVGYDAYILDDVMLDRGKDTILNWCRDTYMKASGQIDAEEGFVEALEKFCKDNNHQMRKIGLENDSMQFAVNDETNLYKAMRMQRFLYKKLCRTFELYQECKEEIDRHNEVFEKNREKQKNTDRFVSFLKAGIIQMEDKLAYYEDSTGKQNVFIKYFSLNALKKEFCEYYTFERFCEVDGEVLKELDDVYQKFLKKAEQDDEVEEAFEAVGGKFKVKAENAVKQLNQYTTQEDFAAIGEADMPDTLINFYNCMKLYC